MSEDSDGGGTTVVDDSGSDTADWSAEDSSGSTSEDISSTGSWDDSSSDISLDTGSETDGVETASADDVEDATVTEVDAELGAVPGSPVGVDGAALLDGSVPADDSIAGGAGPAGVATSFGTVMVDPSTVVGRPDLDQEYFQYQGTGNAFCGPVSAAMALNALTGGSGPSAQEVVDYAVARGWITQDPVNGNPDWGYWSGMTPENLDTLMDEYLAPSGGDADLTRGTPDRLDEHLAAGHPVMVMVDSGELREGEAFDASGEQTPNHFLQVTGIDRVHGQVFLNDPAKTAPSVMPLAQFEAAWQDSGNLMLETRAGTTSPSSPSAADPFGEASAAPAPLIALPSTSPGIDAVPGAPTSGLTTDPSLAAVPPAPDQASGCCVLPMTLQLTPVESAPAPPAPVDPSAAPGQSVVPNQAGLSAPAGLVPLPTGVSAVEVIDGDHVKLDYVPQQIGVQPSGSPGPNGVSSGSGSPGNLFEVADGIGNVFANTIRDGVTQTGSSSTGYTYTAANGQHDSLRDAEDARDTQRGLL